MMMISALGRVDRVGDYVCSLTRWWVRVLVVVAVVAGRRTSHVPRDTCATFVRRDTGSTSQVRDAGLGIPDTQLVIAGIGCAHR